MFQRTDDSRNNTGYKGITLQKVRAKKDHYLTVLAAAKIDGVFHRKQFGIMNHGLEEAMRLALNQLLSWHSQEVSQTDLDTIDYTKAKAWLAENQEEKTIKTNTGIEAVRIINNRGLWYVTTSWSDRISKKQKVRTISIKKHGYHGALLIAVSARCEALDQALPDISDAEVSQGLEWLRSHADDPDFP